MDSTKITPDVDLEREEEIRAAVPVGSSRKGWTLGFSRVRWRDKESLRLRLRRGEKPALTIDVPRSALGALREAIAALDTDGGSK